MKGLRRQRAPVVATSLGITATIAESAGFSAGDLTASITDAFSFITASGTIVAPADAQYGVLYQLYSSTDYLLFNVWNAAPDDCAIWFGAYNSSGASGTVITSDMHNFWNRLDPDVVYPLTYPGTFRLYAGDTLQVYLYGTENLLPWSPTSSFARIRIHCPVYVELTTVGFTTTDVVSFMNSSGTVVSAAEIERGVQYSLMTNATLSQSSSIGRFLQYNTPSWIGGWVGAYDAVSNPTGTKGGFSSSNAYNTWSPPFTFDSDQLDFYLYGLQNGDVTPYHPTTQYAKISIHL